MVYVLIRSSECLLTFHLRAMCPEPQKPFSVAKADAGRPAGLEEMGLIWVNGWQIGQRCYAVLTGAREALSREGMML